LFENYIKETRITDIVQLIVIGGRTDHGVNFFDVPSHPRVMESETRVELNCRAVLNLTILTHVENNPILLPKNNFTCFDLREKCIEEHYSIWRDSFNSSEFSLSLSFSHDSRLMFNFIAEERKRKRERERERQKEREKLKEKRKNDFSDSPFLRPYEPRSLPTSLTRAPR